MNAWRNLVYVQSSCKEWNAIWQKHGWNLEIIIVSDRFRQMLRCNVNLSSWCGHLDRVQTPRRLLWGILFRGFILWLCLWTCSDKGTSRRTYLRILDEMRRRSQLTEHSSLPTSWPDAAWQPLKASTFTTFQLWFDCSFTVNPSNLSFLELLLPGILSK